MPAAGQVISDERRAVTDRRDRRLPRAAPRDGAGSDDTGPHRNDPPNGTGTRPGYGAATT